MKKNKMCRLASILLIMVLLTTSIVGGTFAKYTTEVKASDTARVAKWGVNLTATSGLFAEAYKDTKVEKTDLSATVKTSDANKLVAPGTEGSGLSITSGGTPEVSYKMTIKLDGTPKVPSLEYTPKNAAAPSTYEPVKFTVVKTVGSTDTTIKDGMSLNDLTTLFNGTNAIYMYDVAAEKYYVDNNGDGTISDPEKADSLDAAPTISIKWSWLYEDGTDKALCDELDTILGDSAAGKTITSYSGGADGATSISGVNTDVSLAWTMTATQID